MFLQTASSKEYSTLIIVTHAQAYPVRVGKIILLTIFLKANSVYNGSCLCVVCCMLSVMPWSAFLGSHQTSQDLDMSCILWCLPPPPQGVKKYTTFPFLLFLHSCLLFNQPTKKFPQLFFTRPP